MSSLMAHNWYGSRTVACYSNLGCQLFAGVCVCEQHCLLLVGAGQSVCISLFNVHDIVQRACRLSFGQLRNFLPCQTQSSSYSVLMYMNDVAL